MKDCSINSDFHTFLLLKHKTYQYHTLRLVICACLPTILVFIITSGLKYVCSLKFDVEVHARCMVWWSGWVSVGLVCLPPPEPSSSPAQMGLEHAWLILKDTRPPPHRSRDLSYRWKWVPIHHYNFTWSPWCKSFANDACALSYWMQLTLTKPLLSEMLFVSFNLWKETTWKILLKLCHFTFL